MQYLKHLHLLIFRQQKKAEHQNLKDGNTSFSKGNNIKVQRLKHVHLHMLGMGAPEFTQARILPAGATTETAAPQAEPSTQAEE
eukprot:1161674-Pelagomonas_calceolata.AAC.5